MVLGNSQALSLGVSGVQSVEKSVEEEVADGCGEEGVSFESGEERASKDGDGGAADEDSALWGELEGQLSASGGGLECGEVSSGIEFLAPVDGEHRVS